MARGEQDRLLRVAAAVADREAIDWERESDGADAELQRNLAHLRLVDEIVEAHRSFNETTDTIRSDPEPPARPELDRWGSLQIVARLDGGAYGDVFRAHDPGLQADVALKLLKQVGRDRDWLDEARRLARVRHPNVLTIHGVATHEGRVGLWTELLEGKTLRQCLTEQGPFGAQEAALIGTDLCKALSAVHAAGVVHRDVKAANVMREKGGRIVLLDLSSGTDREQRLPSGTCIGTPAYMAPELFRGEDSGIASDIYSLGVLLYQLVSDRYPVEATSFEDLEQAHREGRVTKLRDVRPDLPTAFVRVVDRALSPDPAARYPTAGAMEQELAGAIGVAASERAQPPWWRRPAFLLGAAAALLVAALAGAMLLMGLRQPLSVEPQWLRVHDGVEERLLPGAALAVDDQLTLELHGSHSMWVYVINEDASGSGTVLFPLDGMVLQNPLDGKRLHRLPGPTVDGTEESWLVTSAGGEETMLVVASREPLPELEREIADMARAGADAGPQTIDADQMIRLRGVGGLAPIVESPAGAKLDELAGRLSRQASGTEGVWVWEVRFNAPTAAP